MARKATPKQLPEDKLIDAALALAAEKPWSRVTMTDIASAAGVSLTEAYDAFSCRALLIVALIRRHDRAMLAGDDPSLAEESRKDRLFDAIMRRLEAMRLQKAGLKSMTTGAVGDMDTLLAVGPSMIKSAKWMLRAAGVSADGPIGFVRSKVVLAVYAVTVQAFMADESDDLSSTMATLDKALKRAGSVLGS